MLFCFLVLMANCLSFIFHAQVGSEAKGHHLNLMTLAYVWIMRDFFQTLFLRLSRACIEAYSCGWISFLKRFPICKPSRIFKIRNEYRFLLVEGSMDSERCRMSYSVNQDRNLIDLQWQRSEIWRKNDFFWKKDTRKTASGLLFQVRYLSKYCIKNFNNVLKMNT